MFTVSEVAYQLDQDPRNLRRMIRRSNDIQPVGVGGRYLLTGDHIEKLKEMMGMAKNRKNTPTRESNTADHKFMTGVWEGAHDDYPAMSVEEMRRIKHGSNRKSQNLWAQRQRKLVEQMKAAGV